MRHNVTVKQKKSRLQTGNKISSRPANVQLGKLIWRLALVIYVYFFFKTKNYFGLDMYLLMLLPAMLLCLTGKPACVNSRHIPCSLHRNSVAKCVPISKFAYFSLFRIVKKHLKQVSLFLWIRQTFFSQICHFLHIFPTWCSKMHTKTARRNPPQPVFGLEYRKKWQTKTRQTKTTSASLIVCVVEVLLAKIIWITFFVFHLSTIQAKHNF